MCCTVYHILIFLLQHLTSLTNEQVVAELGWGREAIRRVLGVTPILFRPPYGDIGELVHASICMSTYT